MPAGCGFRGEEVPRRVHEPQWPSPSANRRPRFHSGPCWIRLEDAAPRKEKVQPATEEPDIGGKGAGRSAALGVDRLPRHQESIDVRETSASVIQ